MQLTELRTEATAIRGKFILLECDLVTIALKSCRSVWGFGEDEISLVGIALFLHQYDIKRILEVDLP